MEPESPASSHCSWILYPLSHLERGVGVRQLQKHRWERWKGHRELSDAAEASWRLSHLLRDMVNMFIGGEVRLVGSRQSRSKNMESRLASSMLCLQILLGEEYLKRQMER